MAAKFKKGDKVVVLAGKDKGKKGEITSVNPSAGKAIVDGVNIAIRHTKQSQTTQGGRIPQAMPIQLSNLALAGCKRQSDPRRLQSRRRQEGARCQDHGGRDLMLDTANYTPRLKAAFRRDDQSRDERRVRLQERHADPAS